MRLLFKQAQNLDFDRESALIAAEIKDDLTKRIEVIYPFIYMSFLPPQCGNLANNVNNLLDLLQQETALKQQDTASIEASLKKAIATIIRTSITRAR